MHTQLINAQYLHCRSWYQIIQVTRMSRHSCFKKGKHAADSGYCHIVSLKSRHSFQQRTCYEVRAVLVKCLWKHCFVQIVILWLIYHHYVHSCKLKLVLDMTIMIICQDERSRKSILFFTEMLISVVKAWNNIHVQLLPHKKLHIEKYFGPFCFSTPTSPMVIPLLD
jgi:hypothetical protein